VPHIKVLFLKWLGEADICAVLHTFNCVQSHDMWSKNGDEY